MGKMLDLMVEMLNRFGCPFRKIRGRPELVFTCTCDVGEWNCTAIADEEKLALTFRSKFPVYIPPSRNAAVREFMRRSEAKCFDGTFKLGSERSPAVYFETTWLAREDQLTAQYLEFAFYYNLRGMSHYYAKLLAVLYGPSSPAQVPPPPRFDPNAGRGASPDG